MIYKTPTEVTLKYGNCGVTHTYKKTWKCPNCRADLSKRSQQSVKSDVMPCGHPLAESYQGEDGGKYCRICESA